MKREVALAVLERNGAWLLQLRDDLESILYPGHWGLFGGHLDADEKPSNTQTHQGLLPLNPALGEDVANGEHPTDQPVAN